MKFFFCKIEKIYIMRIRVWISLESSYINMCASGFLWKFTKDKINAKFHEIKKRKYKRRKEKIDDIKS
jgi:hypothetical protein